MTVEVTVVVPTRDRASLLPTCLDCLAAQRTAVRFEVVVVDNGSSDPTGDVVRARARADARFRLVEEPVAGLSRAKNAGLAGARGRLVLFTDDDVVLPDGWIDALAAFLRESRDRPVLAGGPVLPVPHDLGAWPRWVGDGTTDLPRLYHGPARRALVEFEWLWGANMGAERGFLEAIGGFDVALGNTGAERGTFEDVELVQRVTAAGGECWYLPEAAIHHRTAATAARPRALAAKAFARGANDVARAGRGAYVERRLAVPRRRLGAAAMAPVVLALWGAGGLAFRLTRARLALALARRSAWAAGWCVATAMDGSGREPPRPLRRALELARRSALALTPR